MIEKKKFYLTTPIYYPSDKLHIGHAYCTTIADAVSRFHRAKGEDVFFLTGSDEHGLKIQRKAAEQGVTPKEYVDKIIANFKLLWKRLDISNDDFIRTTDERHVKVVQAVMQKVYDNGDIYKKNYEGWYCVPCESYWTEHQLVDGCCPDCGRPVEKMQEESYFFQMSKYADRVLKFIEDNPEFIQPASRRNEMINFIKQGLEDLCISRTTFDWGIPVPFDPRHVVYVWFDALLNYVTAAGYLQDDERFKKYWPADVHLVGKEIVRFHSIIWPCMLMAAGLPLPKKIYGHGWLVVGGEKMSKSKGNVIDPLALIDEFGADSIRYFLLREINLGSDGNFSRDALIDRVNADLANDLGNLMYRTVSMIEKYHGGVLENHPSAEEAVDKEMQTLVASTVLDYTAQMDEMRINDALKTVWNLIGRANKYIDETSPWKLAKEAEQEERLHVVMYTLAETLRHVAIMIAPFIPQTSPKIFAQLGLPSKDLHLLDECGWGRIPDGTKVVKGDPLFPRIEVTEDGQTIFGSTKKAKEAKGEKQSKSGEQTLAEKKAAKEAKKAEARARQAAAEAAKAAKKKKDVAVETEKNLPSESAKNKSAKREESKMTETPTVAKDNKRFIDPVIVAKLTGQEIPAESFVMEQLKPEITMDDFIKLDLRVATIIAAERVPKTEKLMKLQVKLGDEERVIVSGIAKHYAPEDLLGRNVILVANLKPAKLRGIMSYGMLLAASDGLGNLVLADAPGMISGSRVK